MRFSLVALAAAVAGLVGLTAEAAPESRFVKKIDDRKLDEEWADEEDDEWHEDTFEWKRKIAQKKQPALDLETIQKAGPRMQDLVLEHEAKSGNMQMAFCTLKKGVAKTKFDAEQLGSKWNALMATAGLRATLYAISEDDLLFTDDGGQVTQIRDFLLEQPEVEKFRWKDKDFDKAWLAEKKAKEAEAAAAEEAKLLASGGKKKSGKKGKKSGKKGKKGKKAKKAKKEAEEAAQAAEATPAVAAPQAIPTPAPKADL